MRLCPPLGQAIVGWALAHHGRPGRGSALPFGEGELEGIRAVGYHAGMKLDLPPPRDWQTFEDLCRDLWAERWNDPNAQKHVRGGQSQRGVDVFGQPGGGPAWEGVQCKCYERQLTRAQIKAEVKLPSARGKARPQPALSLPRDLFKGRGAILGTLAAGAGEPTAIVQPPGVIHGLGGIGKTRLAVDYGWRSLERYPGGVFFVSGYPGGVFFVSAETPERLRAGLATLAGADLLNLPERRANDEVEVVGAVLRWLRAHDSWLMILDNADTSEAAGAVGELLPLLDRGEVLVTSRWTSWGREVREQPLDVLDEADARRYLLDATDRRERRGDDEELAGRLAELLGGLPLALEQAAAYIERHRLSLAAYLEEWREERSRVLAWYDDSRMHYPAPVAATWQRTFDGLSASARALLRLVSLLAPEPRFRRGSSRRARSLWRRRGGHSVRSRAWKTTGWRFGRRWQSSPTARSSDATAGQCWCTG